MTVYVDPLFPCKKSSKWPYTQACHMTCDGNVEALHEMADRLGLKRTWFQNHHPNPALHHYDLTPNKRALALRYGAQEISTKERAEMIVSWYRKRREQGDG